MLPTSSMASRRSGFTLIEMTFVIALVALFASLTAPNLISMERSRREGESLEGLRRLPVQARERALHDGMTVHLILRDGTVALAQEDEQGEVGDPTTSLSLYDGYSVGRCQVEGSDSSPEEFDLRFFADGSADPGGFELVVGEQVSALNIAEDGSGSFDEALADMSVARWQAGSYEER